MSIGRREVGSVIWINRYQVIRIPDEYLDSINCFASIDSINPDHVVLNDPDHLINIYINRCGTIRG